MAESHPSRPSLSRRCGEYHIPVLALKKPAAVPPTSLADPDRLGPTARILKTSRLLRWRAPGFRFLGAPGRGGASISTPCGGATTDGLVLIRYLRTMVITAAAAGAIAQCKACYGHPCPGRIVREDRGHWGAKAWPPADDMFLTVHETARVVHRHPGDVWSSAFLRTPRQSHVTTNTPRTAP